MPKMKPSSDGWSPLAELVGGIARSPAADLLKAPLEAALREDLERDISIMGPKLPNAKCERDRSTKISPKDYFLRPAMMDTVASLFDNIRSGVVTEDRVMQHHRDFVIPSEGRMIAYSYMRARGTSAFDDENWGGVYIDSHLDLLKWYCARYWKPEDYPLPGRSAESILNSGEPCYPSWWGLMHRVALSAVILARRDGLDTWTSWIHGDKVVGGQRSIITVRGSSPGELIAGGVPVHSSHGTARKWGMAVLIAGAYT